MSTPPPPHPAYQQPPGPYPPAAPVWPQQYGASAAVCQLCGAMPAAPVTIRGHQGMVVIMRFLRREGMFCRTCALASFRDMQADTMVMGWWGPLSVLITPFTLLANLSALSGIRRIPEPVTAGFRPPLDPGKPVFRRPAGILALIPLGLLGLAVSAFTVLLIVGLVVGPTHSNSSNDSSDSDVDYPTLTVGSCARNAMDWPAQDLRPEPCDSPAAELRVYAPAKVSCASGDYGAYLEYSKDGNTSLCLHPLKR